MNSKSGKAKSGKAKSGKSTSGPGSAKASKALSVQYAGTTNEDPMSKLTSMLGSMSDGDKEVLGLLFIILVILKLLLVGDDYGGEGRMLHGVVVDEARMEGIKSQVASLLDEAGAKDMFANLITNLID